MKLPLDLIDQAEREYTQSPKAIRETRARITEQPAVTLDGQAHYERRREMIAASAAEDIADAFERYIGDNNLLPINYLLLGYLQSHAVGCIRYFDRQEGKGAVATGFLVSPDLVMTNHHVFPLDSAAALTNAIQDPTIAFNREYDVDGKLPEPIEFELAPDRFFYTNKTLDLALIGVRQSDRTGAHSLKSQGYLVLNGQLGKAGLGDFATIIQHPNGREKQIAIRKNEIVNLDQPNVIIYVSDTAQGSSGAPVFNDQWQVIALHSAGVPKKNKEGKYVDATNAVIEPVNGRIDGDRVVWESNRGIRISAIMNHLRQTQQVSSHPLIQVLLSPGYTDSPSFGFLSRPVPERVLNYNVPVTPPTAPSVPAPIAPFSLTITVNPVGQSIVTSSVAAKTEPAESFEKKYEDELDFTDCAGFDDQFMGTYLPMPVPSSGLRKKLAFLQDNPSAYTLKYHHISTIHHAVRRVPIVSGINVHGKYRYAALNVEGSRVDQWYRDNRIDYDVQLNDDFYKKSGFDKGHLARREDAEWGTSIAKAKRAADLTCSYANAVPQVPALNRASFGYKGKWGQLETELLEKGVRNEAGKSARILVFNGPLFDDKDPVFKGVQIALSFYKVVVWYDGDGELRTTCYRLSQEKLVGEIEFEVLQFDEVFKTYQIPIGQIEKVTGLTFHNNIRSCDTSNGIDKLIG